MPRTYVGGGTVPEGQQPSAGQKAPGHLEAGRSLEEGLEDRVAPEQLFPAPGGGRVRGCWSVQVYEIQTPTLPRSVHEPSAFENSR